MRQFANRRVRTVTVSRRSTSRRRGQEGGYVLLYLLLVISLMTILALTVMTPIKFELQREREEEFIHRGVQYSRAIRSYYKKFGRYPTKLEDLDNTSGYRSLRKRYKDPLTGKDFKLLHYGDPGLALSGSIGGGMIPGANTVNSMNGAAGGTSAFGGSGFGGSGSAFGGSGVNSSGAFSQSSSFGGSSPGGNSFGGNSFGGNSGGFGSSSNNSQNSSAQPSSGTDSTQPGSQTPGTASSDASSATQTVFGGGPIVGVASTSKEKTIREFNKKHKYSDWQFIYDPTTDRGGLLMTPYQPTLQLSNQIQNGQTGNTNTNGSSFGQSNGFGNNQSGFGGSGFGNSGFGNSNSGGSSSPPQPPSNPPQQ